MLELNIEGVGWVAIANSAGRGLRDFKEPTSLLLKTNGGWGLLNNFFVSYQVCAYWMDEDFMVQRVSSLEANYGASIGSGVWVLELPLELFRAGLFKVGDVLEIKEVRVV